MNKQLNSMQPMQSLGFIARVLSTVPRVHVSSRSNIDRRPKTRVLLIDQFEELFTSHNDHWRERTDFFIQLNEAMEKEPDLRIIFAMREEYIAYLDGYAHLLPESCRTRVRLERLREVEALEAVVEPLKSKGISFAPGVAEELVQKLLIAGFVEPLELQIICSNCFLKLEGWDTEITAVHMEKHGGVDEALTVFYETALTETVRKTHVSESRLRTWFNIELITKNETRGFGFRESDKSIGGLPDAAVIYLESLHIIRKESSRKNTWYELSHDRLVKPIRQSNSIWQKKKDRHKRQLWSVVGVILIVLSLAFGIHERSKQRRQQQELKTDNQHMDTLEDQLAQAEANTSQIVVQLAMENEKYSNVDKQVQLARQRNADKSQKLQQAQQDEQSKVQRLQQVQQSDNVTSEQIQQAQQDADVARRKLQQALQGS